MGSASSSRHDIPDPGQTLESSLRIHLNESYDWGKFCHFICSCFVVLLILVGAVFKIFYSIAMAHSSIIIYFSDYLFSIPEKRLDLRWKEFRSTYLKCIRNIFFLSISFHFRPLRIFYFYHIIYLPYDVMNFKEQ